MGFYYCLLKYQVSEKSTNLSNTDLWLMSGRTGIGTVIPRKDDFILHSSDGNLFLSIP